MIVGFTGTRDGMSKGQKEMLEQALVQLGATQLHHGCCVGADKQAVEIATQLSIATVGHPPINDRLMFIHTSNYMNDPKPYIERNHDIVDACGILIVAPKTKDEVKRGSGTWATYRYAKKIGRNYILLAR